MKLWQCRSDSNCRGEMICVNGRCVPTQPTHLPQPSTEADYCGIPGGGNFGSCPLCCNTQYDFDSCSAVNPLNPEYCSYCEWDEDDGCVHAGRKGGRLKRGGKINNNNRRNTMRRGGRTRPQPRKTPGGGRTRKTPGGGRTRKMSGGGRTRKMSGGGRPARRMGGGGCVPGTPGCPQGGGYRRGGRTKPITARRMARGRGSGVRRLQSGGSSTPRSGCTMWTGEIDCNNTAGCTWNYSTGMCH